MSSPSADLIDSTVRWWMLPIPDEPYEYLPGLAFTMATHSVNVFAGTDGCTARKSGARAVSDTKVKSFCASYGSDLYTNGLMENIDMSVTSIVYPSAAFCASACAATTPLPPGLFSIT